MSFARAGSWLGLGLFVLPMYSDAQISPQLEGFPLTDEETWIRGAGDWSRDT